MKASAAIPGIRDNSKGRALLTALNPDAKYEIPISDGGRETTLLWDFRIPADLTLKSVTIQGRMQCQIAAAIVFLLVVTRRATRAQASLWPRGKGRECREALDVLGYPYWDETANPAYALFLGSVAD